MLSSPFGGIEGMMFSIVPVLVTVGFIVVFGMIVVGAVRGIGQWKKNNASPVLTVDATVVAKRANVSHHHHQTGTEPMQHHTSTSTTYYATFEVASGDRMEFQIQAAEYGLLVEGDAGGLTFQGTRYLGFERNRD